MLVNNVSLVKIFKFHSFISVSSTEILTVYIVSVKPGLQTLFYKIACLSVKYHYFGFYDSSYKYLNNFINILTMKCVKNGKYQKFQIH